MTHKAIRIKVEGYFTYIPSDLGGETIEDVLEIDLDAADNDPYDHVMAMLESTDGDVKFTGEILDVEVDENGKIILPEAKK